jgi:hypothetical protein
MAAATNAYLWDKLGVHPTSVLNQSVARYETGMLKRISAGAADRIEALKKRVEKTLDLMVAKNCEIFRAVGKFTQRWYLPDLCLKELSVKKRFFDYFS